MTNSKLLIMPVLLLAVMLIAPIAAAKTFNVGPSFDVSDSGIDVKGNYSNGTLTITFSNTDGSSLNGNFYILDAQQDQVSEGELKDASEIRKEIPLEYGDYLLVINNADTGYQEPKLNISITVENAVQYTPSNALPIAFLLDNWWVLVVVILVISALLYIIGKKREKSQGGLGA